MASSRSTFDFYGFEARFNASSPPAPVGPPLLDTHEQKGLENWFESIGSGSVASSNLFDTELPDDSPYWSSEMPSSYQNTIPEMPSRHHHHHQYLSGGMDGYLTSSSVSAAPMAAPSQIDINPFNTSRGLLQRQQGQTSQQLNNHNLLNFGTDTNFAPNGYHPPTLPVPLEDKEVEVRSRVYAAFRNDSTVTTAVNSPTEIKYEQGGGDTEDDDSGTPVYDDNESTPSPSRNSAMLKRRMDGGEDFSKSARKPRSRKSEASMRMAKKKAGGQKRDNLTEAQKRENHIHSEQKRRNLIRQGFEDLCSLVPELSSGGYSKSAVLVHAANYLDDLKKGNVRLRLYLQQLQQLQMDRVY
ncbi:hypothetical protein HOY82DRAFT_488973 [Tuber indicum]|nr:hypothetical protein HOY82DRAFT_488973 [Tuber indicum]